jgi:glutamine amidotransferase-like uncharacterized protein
MQQNIVIYNDEGVGDFGVKCLQAFFKKDDVLVCDAEALIAGHVFEQADMFVMPGGADLPYCKKLNGRGNAQIRKFVEEGGTYLGICAGAYYACRGIEFHKGRVDEISGPRELAFVDAIGVGSLPNLAPYYDNTLNSAAPAPIITKDGESILSFYHGGPAFIMGDKSTAVIHARYDAEGSPPAIIEAFVGDGRAILCGVHLEMTPQKLMDWPFKNEGEQKLMRDLVFALKGNALQPEIFLSDILKG